MKETIILLLHTIRIYFKLLLPHGARAVMAESIALKQQIIILNRGKRRAPPLKSKDRLLFGFLAYFIKEKRVPKISAILKPSTILKFHQALIRKKYQLLFSNKRKRSGRKPPSPEVIQLVRQMKAENPDFGYGRISMQISEAFGIEISRYAVGRILRKKEPCSTTPGGTGPSWLTFFGHMKDSLWSVDLFRCESILLQSHWVMVVMDQFSRKVVGIAVHAGPPDGAAVCRMFNKIRRGKSPPIYLSMDNDPLFEYARWQANLRILDIEEIRSVPGVPTSHPFIERVIGTIRREFINNILFFNAVDLEAKLAQYVDYYNGHRGHSSLGGLTPQGVYDGVESERSDIVLDAYQWKSYCRGLFKLPCFLG